jgi:hypothetical protein
VASAEVSPYPYILTLYKLSFIRWVLICQFLDVMDALGDENKKKFVEAMQGMGKRAQAAMLDVMSKLSTKQKQQLLGTVHYTLYTMHYTPCTTHDTLYTMHSTPNTVHHGF